MADKKCTWCENRSMWLGVGATAGLLTGIKWWRAQQAKRTSPLLRHGEHLTALVTGASSGIGAAYSAELARRGYDVILVARRREKLAALAEQLSHTYGVEATPVTADLSTEADIERIEHVLAATETLNLLVNNAGFGLVEPFSKARVERHLDMVRLHIHAVVRLTRAALPIMLTQRRGAVINVSSLMAYYPLGDNSTYAGTKCYLRAFTEALHQELNGTGVRVQSLCPGFVKTEMPTPRRVCSVDLPDLLWMAPQTVVDQSLRDLARDRVISVPGLGYRILASIAGLVPRRLFYLIGSRVRR